MKYKEKQVIVTFNALNFIIDLNNKKPSIEQ